MIPQLPCSAAPYRRPATTHTSRNHGAGRFQEVQCTRKRYDRENERTSTAVFASIHVSGRLSAPSHQPACVSWRVDASLLLFILTNLAHVDPAAAGAGGGWAGIFPGRQLNSRRMRGTHEYVVVQPSSSKIPAASTIRRCHSHLGLGKSISSTTSWYKPPCRPPTHLKSFFARIARATWSASACLLFAFSS